jgi:hypothetical protein
MSRNKGAVGVRGKHVRCGTPSSARVGYYKANGRCRVREPTVVIQAKIKGTEPVNVAGRIILKTGSESPDAIRFRDGAKSIRPIDV